MSYTLNNDVLSIISIYTGFPIQYEKTKLKIKLNSNCESCNKRMRRTKNSITEAYTFPKLLELDEFFYSENSKYIRTINTLVLHNKIHIPYQEACNLGLINYQSSSLRGYYPQLPCDQVYGYKLSRSTSNLKLYVKKAPSLHIMYKALRRTLDCDNEEEFLNKLKKYNTIGLEDHIISKCIKEININDWPIKMVVRLCYKCRKKIKKGYIFA